MAGELLDGKRVLLVDDEPDVLGILENLLTMCEIEKAHSFHEAKEITYWRPESVARAHNSVGLTGSGLFMTPNSDQTGGKMTRNSGKGSLFE